MEDEGDHCSSSPLPKKKPCSLSPLALLFFLRPPLTMCPFRGKEGKKEKEKGISEIFSLFFILPFPTYRMHPGRIPFKAFAAPTTGLEISKQENLFTSFRPRPLFRIRASWCELLGGRRGGENKGGLSSR